MRKINGLICIIAVLILSFSSVRTVHGTTYFSDNFSGNLNNWTLADGSVSSIGSWSVNEGKLVGSVGYAGSSYIYPNMPFDLQDFVFESDLKSLSGVDANIFFRQSDSNHYYVVGYRFDSSGWPGVNNIVLYKYEYGYSLLDSYPSVKIPRSFSLTQNVNHKIKIISLGKMIKIYFDGNLAVSYVDNGSVFGPGKIALQNWGGTFTGQVINEFDNVIISDGITTSNKIIFLPGLGASWNERAMVLNQSVIQSDWRMTPFVTNYNSLFKGFEDNGLIKNKDYFVYNYDWRKPLANQIDDFNNYINGLGLTSGEKVDIVGHSFGGVIGRIWSQENQSKVGKILTLASPHSGAVGVYEMWNGAKISNPTDPGTIALNVLLALQSKNNQTSVETMRTYVPALKDLLPTFNYLKKNGATLVPPENLYLSEKNKSVSSVFDQLLTVSGSGSKTKEWINLGDRSVFDTVLGRWEQGFPVNYLYTDGDGTVLKKSSTFAGDVSTMVNGEHGQVPDKSVNVVLTELGLGKTTSVIATPNFSGSVFYIGSPASMKVNCGAGDISELDGFVLVSGRNISDCIVKLTGIENGIYHLVLGNSGDDESWKYIEGNISIGGTKNISINQNDFWYEQMLRETNGLLTTFPNNVNLKNMKSAIGMKNRTSLVSSYVLFRKQKLETLITWRMINYLEKIINIEVPTQTTTVFNNQKNLALSGKSLADKTASLMQRQSKKPTQWQALNYSQAEQLLLSPNYGKYLLAEKIFGMVWY